VPAIELTVVGAGVIGLAVAREAARRGMQTLVLEAGDTIGCETSSRNSEVIHAGIYYPPGSLKARHCVTGRRRLYRYLSERGVPHRRCGKLIVATCEAEEKILRDLLRRSVENGLTGTEALQYLGREDAVRMEPRLRASAALFSPSSGIVDSHALMLALQGDAESAGAQIVLRTRVDALVPGRPHTLSGTSVGQPWALQAAAVVMATGLHSTGLMRETHLAALAPEIRFVKGSYFALSGSSPFSRLVYPVPTGGGLGIHAALDLAGQTRFGPDAEPVEHLGYQVDLCRKAHFESAIRRYWPELPGDRLYPAYAGVRPRVKAAGGTADFLIQGPAELGEPRLVFLHGIESPGLTAALSLAEAVCDLLPGRR